MTAAKPLAELVCRQDRCEEALSVARAAIERARLFGFRAGANTILADVHAAMGNWADCRDAARNALSAWQISGPRFRHFEEPRVESLLRDAEAHLR
jgi:hypothetical protein